MEIRFKVPVAKTEEDDKAIIERVARIVTWEPKIFVKESGYKYQLDTSNNWWAGKEGDEFVLAYRYGDATQMQMLKSVIEWLVVRS